MREAEMLNSAIKKLEIFLVEKAGLQKTIKKEVEAVKNEMTSILDFLRDKKLEEGSSSSLRYMIYDVMEMAEKVIPEVESPYNDDDLDSMKKNIHFFRSWIRGTKECMLRSSSENVGGEEVEEVGVVGLEDGVEWMLHNRIFNDEKRRGTICIMGMGGIGKTTLARELYNHPAVVDGFECRAWACLSRDLCRKEVLMKLMRQLVVDISDHEFESRYVLLDNKTLRDVVYQQLQSKRYFIVLDDLWEYKHWLYIKEAIPYQQDKASRLLFTGRTENVAGFMTDCYRYDMKFLDHEKSWRLFLKTVFFGSSTNYQEFPKHLEKRGRDMLAKCNGLPLAIKEVGRQLAMKKRCSKSGWEELLLLLESTDLGATLEVVGSSYHQWPPKMKSCFLHLCFFKEVRKEIIEAKGNTKDHRTKNYRINPFFHRLAIKKAEEEIGFEVVLNDGKNRPSQEPRHRAIYCSREKFMYSTDQDKHLVSLFFHGGGYFETSPSYWRRFELLKILDFEDFGLIFLPEMIGALTRLKYLGLRNNYIEKIPCSLRCLKKLEVLDIALNFMVEVPDIIWEMDSLRELQMSDIICLNPLKIDALKNLETLTYISVDNWKYELSGLEMMTSLSKLGIEDLDGSSDVNKLFTSLTKLKTLDYLILRGFRFKSMPSLDQLGILRRLTQLKVDGLLTRLPSADNFPPYIKYLTLANTCLDEDPMPELGKLGQLTNLELRNAYTGQQMVINMRNGFPRLNVLCMGELWHLRNIRFEKGARQRLVHLEINNCPYLETFPEEITKLWTLTMVTTKNIASKIRESGLVSKILRTDIHP
ncbi:hypothetical protein C2S53_017878 [Perilla frutescens var. hirtella]|uniref:NB-ARC domain-containing protein n=1 Tax=Perilla frutescens var. hirtella TaxID=608512 RepID=A0AAD4J1B9_PERFH|nr:hypothetical protein C2S53_017878 [Perilla frutescens var. hirtella]